MRRIVLGCFAGLALTACQETASPDAPSADPSVAFGPGFADSLKAACEADGGRWGVGGANRAQVCFRETGENLKACSSANDCIGVCLARSRTCAPVTPLLGCNEVLTADGFRQTQCVE